MKALLIVIIIIILCVFGYNKYSDHQRFSLENYEYKGLDASVLDGKGGETALLYFQKVEELNGYVITQWSANGIDVRNPENDKEATLAARVEYDKLKGEVAYLENKLQSTEEEPILDTDALERKKRHDRIKELFTSTSNNALRIGSRGALVFELQKLLNKNGSDIPQDGNFQRVTFQALKSFEDSKGLFPDGKLDMLTLEYLLEK